MCNLKLTIEYDGTNYCGWQIQRSQGHKVTKSQGHQVTSIQEVLEKTLQKILQEKVKLVASGRTDSGVHAFAQVANFKINSCISPDKLQRALNGLLPKDIAVKKIETVDLDFHSRYSAKSKTYRYIILNAPQRSAFLKDSAYFYAYPLDLSLMRKEAKCLLGRHDFKSFCASGSKVKSTVRTIKQLAINKLNSEHRTPNTELIYIDIEADGFLYNMVRNIAGTLIEIGRGKLPKGSLRNILVAKNRKLAGPTAPALGLTLLEVKYPANFL